jgi:hypothetical protein
MERFGRFAYKNPYGYQCKLSGQDRKSIEFAIHKTWLFHHDVVILVVDVFPPKRIKDVSLCYRLEMGGLYDVTVVKRSDKTWEVQSIVAILDETE